VLLTVEVHPRFIMVAFHTAVCGSEDVEDGVDLDFSVAKGAAKRWWDRDQERAARLSAIREGRISDVESPKRIKKRLDRLTEAALRQNVRDRRSSRLVETIGLERVLGKADFLGVNFLETALAISRFVGRINIRSMPGQTSGFGTGFMVSPRLLLTNNHVLRTERVARYSEVEFDYQYDRYGRLLPVVVYGLEPETFFITSTELDFTLVAVRESSLNGIELRRYAWIPLIGAQGKALLGDSLNIVQHPKGEAKQIVLRSNQLVDLFDDFAHYVTDTEPGSSGSPVLSDQMEAVALHHSSIPKTENGKYVAKDGSVWRQGMDPDDLAWVANEGIRMSSIVNHVKKATLAGEQWRLREEMLNSESPDPLEAAAAAREYGDAPPAQPGSSNASFTWTIPLRVTVHLGPPSQQPVPSPAPPGALAGPLGGATARLGASVDSAGVTVGPPDMLSAPTGEAISIDPDYGNRGGYDPEFLGTGSKKVPLPRLSDTVRNEAAINREEGGQGEYVLPYHHFSVVMSKRRKLAIFTAVNVDGTKRAHKVERKNDRWFLDPRIGKDEQTGEAVYANNPLDRGHLVRRLDPAWGDTLEQAKIANDDTFHFTNCCPQHKNFNQNETTWAGLEDYILDNAIAQDLRISVHTGPVFSDQDPHYRGVQLPRQFWKVVVMVKEDGSLSATAYLLSQESLLENLEGFEFGAYETYQVAVRKVEELTGLDFGGLKRADPAESLEAIAREDSGAREIVDFEDLAF
jgi:endonuclease G, mitochondrial